jgi:hypothetical protein
MRGHRSADAPEFTKRAMSRREHLGGSTHYLGSRFRSFQINELELVSRIFASWNQLDGWLRQVEQLRRAA